MERDVLNRTQGLVKDGGKKEKKGVQEVINADFIINPLVKQ